MLLLCFGFIPCGKLGWDSASALAQPPRESEGVENQLRQLVLQQVRDWNRGDIDAFMQGYWKSEKLSFASGGQVTRGWQATRDRYHRRYPDRAAMGDLEFSQLEVELLGSDAAYMLGRWKLRKEASMEGNFTLLFRKIEGEWKIVHDHTSKLDG